MQMKKIALMAAALLIVPAASQAQEHKEHAQMPGMQPEHMQMMMQQHEQFVQSLIDKRADLELNADQVTKLQAFKAKMAEHHKAMMQDPKMMQQMMKHDSSKMSMMHSDTTKMSGMKHDASQMAAMHGKSTEDSMHKELMDIFTPAQRVKVEALMKEHMKECASGDMKCSVK
ncbi:MAG TPA: hypothetical protein VF021_05000 [Longimicrobiales bacterium]